MNTRRSQAEFPSFLLVLLGIVCVMTACSRKELNRQSAAELIRVHESRRYDEACKVDYWQTRDLQPGWGVSPNELGNQLASHLGRFICFHTVEVMGIALTTETIRDVHFKETRTYDPPKVAALSAYVDGLYSRLASLPVQAEQAATGGGYELVVVEPASKREFSVRYSRTGSGFSQEFASKLATTEKLELNQVWRNLPQFLAQHQDSTESAASLQIDRLARIQLFDDGRRITSISTPGLDP